MKAIIEVEALSRYTHYDPDLEGAVLGAILLEKDCLINIMGLLNEDILFYEENKLIYRTIIWMWEKGLGIDLYTVIEFIYQKGIDKWEKISTDNPAYYITRLTNTVVSTAHIETHCLLLTQMYVNRLLFEAKYSKEYSMDAALETRRKIDEAFNVGAADNWMTIEEVINKKLIKRMNDPKGFSIIETSFQKLNKVSPIEPGDYIIIGARTSIGKTALETQLAGDIAINGNNVGIITLETKSEKLATRMLAAQSRINFWQIWQNKLTESETANFYNTASKVCQLPIHVHEKPVIDHTGIRIIANKLRRKTKGNLVIFIDYIQLVAPEEKTKLDRTRQIEEISRTIKIICMELENTSVIALAQLNRDASKEAPRMHHLKESGALEQDADKVWLLHRDKEKQEEERMQGKTIFDASLVIEKNKEGWTGEIDLEFNAEQMTFAEKDAIQAVPETAWKPYAEGNENPF
jgi:replicative DNA helicase